MLTEGIARFINKTEYTDFPEKAIIMAKKGILDCIGNSLVGKATREGQIILDYIQTLGGRPEAMVVGVGIRTSPPLAALANGTLASATNCTDTSLTWNIGHPTETILPAILALGEKYQASGNDLLTSYIVGFEVGSKIGPDSKNISSLAGIPLPQ